MRLARPPRKFAPASGRHPHAESVLELPTSHRLPLSWLNQAASPPIQYRALVEVAPESARDPARLEELRAAARGWKPAQAVARKQKDTGVWGGNILGPAPAKAFGWTDTGTVFQYLHLAELGWAGDERPFRLADRLFFRLLSRDEDPALLAEFQKPAKADPALALWARQLLREGAACGLARGGHGEDPRLRGAAHNMASDISAYLRSPLVEKPFRKAQGKTVLDPAARPPTVFAVEMLAFMPTLQRERAGFIERLAAYLSTAAPKRAFMVLAGRKLLPSTFVVLGDPLRADAQGRVSDVPFALYWLELLARLGILRQVPAAARVAARLFSECDETGIWSPKALRTMPKSTNPLVAHYFPLEGPGKSPAQRQTDATFRLALIARLLGIPVEVT